MQLRISLTAAACALLLLASFGAILSTAQAEVAHGPFPPPDPWEVAHGPFPPPDPWEVAHGPFPPPDPWEVA